jgi:hypothetical protein
MAKAGGGELSPSEGVTLCGKAVWGYVSFSFFIEIIKEIEIVVASSRGCG